MIYTTICPYNKLLIGQYLRDMEQDLGPDFKIFDLLWDRILYTVQYWWKQDAKQLLEYSSNPVIIRPPIGPYPQDIDPARPSTYEDKVEQGTQTLEDPPPPAKRMKQP